jgi:hypothetical protein
MARAFIVAAGTLAVVVLLGLGATERLQGRAAHAAVDRVDRGSSTVVPPSSVPSRASSLDDEEDGLSRTDLEGDEVSPALATYGIDRDGNLFEVHSPHTEVPRLSGPIS